MSLTLHGSFFITIEASRDDSIQFMIRERIIMVGTMYTLIPALLTILLVIVTKRVILSLGIGVISAALILATFSIGHTISILLMTFSELIVEKDGLYGFLNEWNISIIFFLIALGIMTAYIVLSGGASAFTQAIIRRIKTREGVQYASAILGILIFVDDYFNALVVGNVSKPLAQQKKISRAKLAYIVDSTSAPICVISPVSSWATGIMGSMAVILAGTGITYSAFSAFLMTIPYHFYVITSIIMVFIVIGFNLNVGLMKKYEQDTLKGHDSSTVSSEISGVDEMEIQSSKGTIWDLILPILTLIIVTVGMMVITGIRGALSATQSDFNFFFSILDHIALSPSLRYGGLAGLIVSMVMTYRHVLKKEITNTDYIQAFLSGIRSMFGAIGILLLAWAICKLVNDLEAGSYLASVITRSNLNPNFIPVIMFIVASLMAFSTGTSWGSFGILLPIAGSVAATIDLNLMIPVMAAVLSGAIFGDHASPISDTTLLSATGSGCDLGAHFNSQLPYALLSATIAAIGYLTFGFGGSLIISYLVMGICFISIIFYARRQNVKVTENLSLVPNE